MEAMKNVTIILVAFLTACGVEPGTDPLEEGTGSETDTGETDTGEEETPSTYPQVIDGEGAVVGDLIDINFQGWTFYTVLRDNVFFNLSPKGEVSGILDTTTVWDNTCENPRQALEVYESLCEEEFLPLPQNPLVLEVGEPRVITGYEKVELAFAPIPGDQCPLVVETVCVAILAPLSFPLSFPSPITIR